ncbi:MAG: tetratricopeptide repeat protein [Paludibacter sp.]|jgi:tetratricopeptide (TPR) repeat protein|nr:tetratricopeptide repeat protein [Paludibacter sp.]
MKKLIFSLLVIASITGIYAQKSNVNKAKAKSNINAENPDFKGARELIKLALEDPTTKDLANTWFVAGNVGNYENDYYYTQILKSKPYDKDAKGQAIVESYYYYLKAYELDGLPNEKGKISPKFQKDIKNRITQYYTNQQNLFVYGAYLLESSKYDKAIEAWNIYLEIPDLPFIQGVIAKDSDYYKIKYYTAIAYLNSAKNDSTIDSNKSEKTNIAISYFEDLRDKGFQEVAVHQLLYQEYFNKKDTASFVKILKAGFEKFPQETWFLGTLINFYIYASDEKPAAEKQALLKEAYVYLEKAVTDFPNEAEYFFVKGNISEQLGNIEQAQSDFEQALKLNPNHADSYNGIGRLLFNKAVEKDAAANDIRDTKLYNAEKIRIKDDFAKALPYIEKAYQLKPDNYEYQSTLKKLYYRLDMQTEYDKIDKIMKGE